MSSEIRVVVDARFIPGSHGGVETFAMGLARGLATLDLVGFRCVFVVYEGVSSWVSGINHERIDFLSVKRPAPSAEALRKRTRLWALRKSGQSFGTLPPRDRFLDSLSADVVHLPFQHCRWTKTPYIYHPHDLQHRHFPGFFSDRALARREVHYSAMCKRASFVSVGTSWTKKDLCAAYDLRDRKVAVVALGVSIPGYGTQQATDQTFGLPADYVVFPGASWPHKNHDALIEAIARLQLEGIKVPLVLTGPRHGGVDLGILARRHGVESLVHDLGYMQENEAAGVLQRARALVMPSLFESASFPIWEAFSLGVPVAASAVTSLPDQLGESGLKFDPKSPGEITKAIRKLWLDSELRADLVDKGRRRVESFTWEATARDFCTLYGATASPRAQHLKDLANDLVEPRL